MYFVVKFAKKYKCSKLKSDTIVFELPRPDYSMGPLTWVNYYFLDQALPSKYLKWLLEFTVYTLFQNKMIKSVCTFEVQSIKWFYFKRCFQFSCFKSVKYISERNKNILWESSQDSEEAFYNRFASVYIVCRCDIFSELFEKMSKMT